MSVNSEHCMWLIVSAAVSHLHHSSTVTLEEGMKMVRTYTGMDYEIVDFSV